MKLLTSITNYIKAIQLINKLKLWNYVLIPGLVSLVLAGLIFWLAWTFSDEMGDWITSWYNWKGEGIVTGIGSFLSGALVLVLAFMAFKYIIIILVGPLMTPISERIESYLDGNYQQKPFRIVAFFKSVSRGVSIALRNIARELFFTAILVLLTFFFPPVAPVTGTLILLIQAYYAGFGNMDYTLDRHLNYGDSINFVRRNRGIAIGNGIVYVGLLLLLVGFLIAPPIATAAATISTVKALQKQNANS